MYESLFLFIHYYFYFILPANPNERNTIWDSHRSRCSCSVFLMTVSTDIFMSKYILSGSLRIYNLRSHDFSCWGKRSFRARKKNNKFTTAEIFFPPPFFFHSLASHQFSFEFLVSVLNDDISFQSCYLDRSFFFSIFRFVSYYMIKDSINRNGIGIASVINMWDRHFFRFTWHKNIRKYNLFVDNGGRCAPAKK